MATGLLHAGNRIAPVHYQQLRGLRHVVDAQDEGQAAREGCVSQLRVKDQVVAPSRTTGRAVPAGRPVRPGAARSHCTVAAADAARCSVPVAAAV